MSDVIAAAGGLGAALVCGVAAAQPAASMARTSGATIVRLFMQEWYSASRRSTFMTRFAACSILIFSTLVSTAAQQIGPRAGSLVIVGGAMRDPAIITRFIELAGGPDAPIVVVPTAGDAADYDQFWSGLAHEHEHELGCHPLGGISFNRTCLRFFV